MRWSSADTEIPRFLSATEHRTRGERVGGAARTTKISSSQSIVAPTGTTTWLIVPKYPSSASSSVNELSISTPRLNGRVFGFDLFIHTSYTIQ